MQMVRFMVTIYGHIKHKGKIKVAVVLVIFTLFCAMLIDIILYKLENKQTENKDVTKKVSSYTDYKEVKINEEMIVITYSILRSKPDENSSNLGVYNKGDKIKVTSKLSNNWYKVKTEKNYGYIKCDNVKSSKEVFIDKDGVLITSVIPDNTIKIDGDVSDNIVNYAYNYWYLIPENIRNDFKNQGWTIILTDKSLSQDLGINYPISGVTIVEDKTVKICGNQSCIRYALVHEIGHYIDFRNNFISRGDKFKEMYKSSGNKMLEYNNNYVQASYSEEEYFAELYRAYLLGDYKIKLVFSNEIDFVLQSSNNIGAVYKDEAA